MTSKAKITIGNNTVEFEGSEEFVSKYLDSYRELLDKSPKVHQAPQRDGHAEGERKQVTMVGKSDGKAGKSDGKPRKKRKTFEIEKFDIDRTDTAPSLEEFYQEKISAKSKAREILLVIAYYVQCVKQIPTFSEGNIDYGYKVLGVVNRPVKLNQMIIDSKNDNEWYERDDTGKRWMVTRVGEIYVESKLPSEPDKK